MEVSRAIILAAGFGTRVLPLTKETPKPLLIINKMPLIEYSIKVLNELGIQEIAVNTHYLKNKISEYLKQKYPKIKIFDEKIILDTGGALVNAREFFLDKYFLVLNSDTVWQKNYIFKMKALIDKTINNNFLAGLLLSKKENSFDKNLKPDFSIEDNFLTNKKEFIYTGFQILNSKLLEGKRAEPFSVKKIWDDCINFNCATGEIIDNTFYHATNIEIYEKLKNKNIIF